MTLGWSVGTKPPTSVRSGIRVIAGNAIRTLFTIFAVTIFAVALATDAGAAAGRSFTVNAAQPEHQARLSVTTFCSHLPLANIDSIVGASVSLAEKTTKGKILACVYSGITGNMSIETETGLSAASTDTLSGAEASARSMFPPGLKIKFAAVPSLGSTAYTWTAVIGGSRYCGLNTNHGSTGYFVEMGGAPRLSVLEKLIKLAIDA